MAEEKDSHADGCLWELIFFAYTFFALMDEDGYKRIGYFIIAILALILNELKKAAHAKEKA